MTASSGRQQQNHLSISMAGTAMARPWRRSPGRCITFLGILPFGSGRFRVLGTFGVADRLTIGSLTIDGSSVPRRQAQQSSIVNSPGTAALPAGTARWAVWLRLRRAAINLSVPDPFRKGMRLTVRRVTLADAEQYLAVNARLMSGLGMCGVACRLWDE
jgi:hypothetical protein